MGSIFEDIHIYHSKINDIPLEIESLMRAWEIKKKDPFILVDYLHITGEYVDNEFFLTLSKVKASPNMTSVLYIRDYNKNLKSNFDEAWINLKQLEYNYNKGLIYETANEILYMLSHGFSSSFEDDEKRTYSEVKGLIARFIDEMQNSRHILFANIKK